MDAKLIDLCDLLYDIEDMRQKAQLQLGDLDDYFNNVTSVISRRASINCSIAMDYVSQLEYTIAQVKDIIEGLITESANKQMA